MTINCKLPFACDVGTISKLKQMLESVGNTWHFYVDEPVESGDIITFFDAAHLAHLLDLVRRFGFTGD